MFQTRKEDMSVERTPIAFGDMRGWIEALRAQGELQEINGEVDWNIELGTIMRLAQGPGTGKALMIAVVLLVLIVELLNSAIEAAVDRISLENHALAKRAKDIGSAAVFIALINVPVVWGLVLFG